MNGDRRRGAAESNVSVEEARVRELREFRHFSFPLCNFIETDFGGDANVQFRPERLPIGAIPCAFAGLFFGEICTDCVQVA
jgi:hypothetical protein